MIDYYIGRRNTHNFYEYRIVDFSQYRVKSLMISIVYAECQHVNISEYRMISPGWGAHLKAKCLF